MYLPAFDVTADYAASQICYHPRVVLVRISELRVHQAQTFHRASCTDSGDEGDPEGGSPLSRVGHAVTIADQLASEVCALGLASHLANRVPGAG